MISGGGAVQLQPGELPELEEGGPHTTRRAVDEHSFAAADAGDAVEMFMGGEVVDDDAGRLGRIDLWRSGYEPVLGKADVLHVAAVHTEGPRAADDELTPFE